MDIKQGWCSKTPIIHLLCGPDVLSLLQNLPHVTLMTHMMAEQGMFAVSGKINVKSTE